MLSSNLLDCLIIILVFILLIGFFIKFIKKDGICTNTNENFEQITNQENKPFASVTNEQITKSQTKKIKPYTTMINQRNVDLCSNKTLSDSIYPQTVMDTEIDQYIKKYPLGGKMLCEPEQTEFTRKDIQDYQNNFFGFYDKINYNTNQEEDVVDKLNELNVVHGNEFGVGGKISDLYNKLTQNVYTAPVPPNGKICSDIQPNVIKDNILNNNLVNPHVDIEFHNGYYTNDAHDGSYISNYSWKYKNDNVNNGGKFYNNIEATDNDIYPQMTIF